MSGCPEHRAQACTKKHAKYGSSAKRRPRRVFSRARGSPGRVSLRGNYAEATFTRATRCSHNDLNVLADEASETQQTFRRKVLKVSTEKSGNFWLVNAQDACRPGLGEATGPNCLRYPRGDLSLRQQFFRIWQSEVPEYVVAALDDLNPLSHVDFLSSAIPTRIYESLQQLEGDCGSAEYHAPWS
jgi:hypothetical protein